MKTIYCVEAFPTIARQVGDNYCHEWDGDSVLLGEFDNSTDAYRLLHEVAHDDFTVHPFRRGLQTVTYTCWEINRYVISDDGSDEEGPDYIDGESSLSTMAIWAMERHQDEYHDWLDYKRDYYSTIDELLSSK